VLRALGVTPELLPEQPAMREPWLITFTPPEERNVQNTKEGPVSTVVWVWKLRPITGEPGVIPEVSIPYFDTSQREEKSVIIPASPIGYASFASNNSEAWQSGFKASGWQWAAGLSGIFVAIFSTLRGMQFTSAPIKRIQNWMDQRAEMAELKRLEKHSDLLELPKRSIHQKEHRSNSPEEFTKSMKPLYKINFLNSSCGNRLTSANLQPVSGGHTDEP